MVKILNIDTSNINEIINIKNLIEIKKPIACLIHMDGCGFCIELMPIWNKLSKIFKKNFKGDGYIITINEKVLELSNISIPDLRGYPHIMVFNSLNNNNSITTYDEVSRDKNILKQFMVNHLKLKKKKMTKNKNKKRNKYTRKKNKLF
jgi:signal peptidase I